MRGAQWFGADRNSSAAAATVGKSSAGGGRERQNTRAAVTDGAVSFQQRARLPELPSFMGSTGDIFFFQHGAQRAETRADRSVPHRQEQPRAAGFVSLGPIRKEESREYVVNDGRGCGAQPVVHSRAPQPYSHFIAGFQSIVFWPLHPLSLGRGRAETELVDLVTRCIESLGLAASMRRQVPVL